jgi:hypothetical protein
MRVTSALGLLCCCTACITPAVRSASTATAVPVQSGATADPDEMARTLQVELEPRASEVRETVALPPSYARGKLRVELRKDGRVEYRLSLYNPGRETFTAAHIIRAHNGDGAAGTPVVTLFSSATLTDRYVDVRGTAIVLELDQAEFLDELRREPAAFFVNVRSTKHPAGALRGRVQ